MDKNDTQLQPLFAVPQAVLMSFGTALHLCICNGRVRKIILMPWLIGLCVSILVLIIGALYLQPALTAAAQELLGTSDSMIRSAVGWAVGIVLYCFLALWSLCVVLLLFAFFQDQIAAAVLREHGLKLPCDAHTLGQAIRFSLRSFLRALLLLLVLLPVLLLSLLLSMTVLFAPVGFVLMSWVVAVQCFDPCGEALDLSFARRLRGSVSNLYCYVIVGAIILMLGLIPLSILFLPPLAIVSAAVLVARKVVQLDGDS